MMHRKFLMFAGVIIAVAIGLLVHRYGDSVSVPAWRNLVAKETIQDATDSLEQKVGAEVRSRVAKAGLQYPPERLVIVGLKEERFLEVWASPGRGVWHPIADYPVLAASGELGPKLRDGDRQVPEGIYEVVSRKPRGARHFELELSYPNEFDQARAAEVGRTDVGGEIFIHGEGVSTGSLAVGDDAIEELFVLVGDVGLENVRVILAPRDLRRKIAPHSELPWVTGLYAQIADAMKVLRARE